MLKTLHIIRRVIKKYDLYPIINVYDKSNPTDYDLINLTNYNNLPNLDDYENIPNILFQTYYNKEKVPDYIYSNIYKYAKKYKYVFFDDTDAIIFLTKYFNKIVVKRFKEFKIGAHKADLLRYCFLYVYGGIYLDIKTILIKPLDEIFTNSKYFYTCIIDFNTVLYNGIIASKPRNKLFLQLIWYMIDIKLYDIIEYTKLTYLKFCKDFYVKIQKDLINSDKLTPGLHIGITQNYYLFQEHSLFDLSSECVKFDRYGGCISIYDKNDKIFIGRDPLFPW